MADRVENQTTKSEADSVKATASGRSFADAFSDQESRATSDLGSPDNSTILTARTTADKALTPTKLPADGIKPEPDAAARGQQKVAPDNSGTAPRETQTSRDAVTPTSLPADKNLNPGANPGVTPKAGEQQRASTDGVVPKVQNLEVQPPSQRSADLPSQPVTNAANAPERAPDKFTPAAAEQHSDRSLLPGLAIIGPESKAQQGSTATVGTSDGRVHDPAVPKQQDAVAKTHDPAIAKPEVLGGKASDTGLRGAELGTGALTGKIQASPDHIKSDDAVRHPGVQSGDGLARQANGESVLKNFTAADGTRSGIDHTIQGVIAKGADGKGLDGSRDGKLTDGKSFDGKADGIRSGTVSLNDGKIADGKITDGKIDGDRGQTRLPDGRIPDGKIGDGKTPGGRPSEVKLGDGKIGDGSTAGAKPGDRLPDGKVGGKVGGEGGSAGPSAFIQFIESQAGIRGFGLPAKTEGSKPEAKSDGKADSKADGTKSNSASADGKTFVSSDTKGGASVPGGRSNAVDSFLGLVETVKDNIKGSLKNLGDRSQPSVPLKEGELAAVAMRGKMPPLRDDITSEQILAVLIPKGLVGWSIVRAPGIKPSDSPLPVTPAKFEGGKLVDGKANDGKTNDGKTIDGKVNQPEPKPFDINSPEAKSRPFVQLHGVDSNYTGAGVRRTEPAAQVKVDQVKVEPVKAEQTKPIPVKAEPLTDTKIAATTPATAGGAAPYLDVSATNHISDQSATRQTMPTAPKDRRQLIEEQEHTLPSASEGDKRLRYVNSALDAQEATWNSEDDDANNGRELQAPLGRYTYIVRAGDTVESVAVVELNDLSLAPLLFKKNKKYVLPEEEYGRHPLVPGVVIDLPTPAEIKAFRQF